jgi:hypothetical protein
LHGHIHSSYNVIVICDASYVLMIAFFTENTQGERLFLFTKVVHQNVSKREPRIAASDRLWVKLSYRKLGKIAALHNLLFTIRPS